MHVTLVVPRLLSLPREALALRALGRLGPSTAAAHAGDLDVALLEALGVEAAPAPLAALGAGVDVGSRWIARADPVTMTVAHDGVRLDARVDDLDACEAAELHGLLSRHFADDGLRFLAPRPDAWFVARSVHEDVSTTPLATAVGRALRERMPQGRDAARWRRWLTEAQMLLHEHALAARPHPVNGLWFSGGGVLAAPADVPMALVQRAPAREGDVAAGIARLRSDEARPLDAFAALVANASEAIAVLPPVGQPRDVERFAGDWLVPAVEALDAARIGRLTVIADGHGAAVRWNVQRRRWIDRLRAVPAFAPPERRE